MNMRKIFENAALILFVVFVAGGLIYSFIQSRETGATKRDLIEACNQAEQGAEVFESFALEAASARRRNADQLSARGQNIAAANEIATAKKYEGFARKWHQLTIHNCEEYYGN